MVAGRGAEMRTIAKIILTLIFVSSGAMKILDTEAFTSSVASFHVFPAISIPVIVATVPWLEILASLEKKTKSWQGGAALTIFALCLGFATLYGTAIALGITPDCGCFGDNPLLKATPPEGVVRGLALAGLAVVVWAPWKKQGKHPSTNDEPSTGD